MLNRKEALTIILATIVLSLVISVSKGTGILLWTFLFVFLVIMINVISKKIAGFYLESEIEIETWMIKRYGFKPTKYFRRPLPAGIFFPIIIGLISLGKLIWMAVLTFEVKPKSYRAVKRHGLYSFSEMTESHIGKIASVGIIANL